jgi:triosephosphate isomerase (TIM)
MRKMIIAGNWKMNKNVEESNQLTTELLNGFENKNNAEVILCPPFTNLSEVNSLIKDSSISLGSQNISEKESGAYTGEISVSMLKSVGCDYAIIGHSERREYYNEDNALLNSKINITLANGLKAIYCMGETLEQRESDKTFDVIDTQITEGLKGLSSDQMANVVIAYEPIWAIGTGKTASPEQANDVHAFIRKRISELFDATVAENTSILYGGSVKPSNATDLLGRKDIDGALVGGASLKAEDFKGIINY